MGKTLAKAFIVTELIQAGKAFLDMAGNLTDLSAKSGITTTALQKLKFAAEQNGGTLEQVTNAIAQMSNRLVNGDKSAVAALGKLGLSVADIRKMSPDQAFTALADAIAKVPDPMGQSALAMALFGKSGADMLPMMKGNLTETANEAERLGLIVGEDVVKAADDFGDSLGVLFTQGMALIGQVLSPILPILQGLLGIVIKVAQAVGPVLGGAFEIVIGAGRKALDFLVGMAKKVGEFVSKIPGMSTVMEGVSTAITAIGDGAKWLHENLAETDEPAAKVETSLGTLTKTIGPLKSAQDAATKAAREHTKALEEQAAIDKRIAAAKIPLTEAQKHYTAELLKLGIAESDIAKKLGVSEIALGRYADQWKNLQKVIAEEIPRIKASRQELLDALAVNPFDPSGMKQGDLLDLIPRSPLISPLIEQMKRDFASVDWEDIAQTEQIREAFDRAEDAGRGAARAVKSDWVDAAMAISNVLLDMAGDSDSAFARIVRDIAEVIDAYKQASVAADNFRNAQNAGDKAVALAEGIGAVWQATGVKSRGAAVAGGALTGAKIGGAIVPGWGHVIGGAAGAIAGWIRSGGQGREEVEKFADSMGGFDALHKKLMALGKEGENLWIKLTQGVGKNNPQQAVQVINQVTTALGEHEAAIARQQDRYARAQEVMAEYGFTMEDTGQKFRNAKLAEQFDALYEKTLTLREVGIDFDEILRRQAGEYSNLVNVALSTNTEIDSSMRPILQKMVDMGILLDENGNAFTSLEDISWATTMSQGFRDVTEAIYSLKDALTKGVGGAIDDISRRRVTIPVSFSVDDAPDVTVDRGERYPGFSGGTPGLGYVDFGRATPTWLHGREAVIPEGRAGDLAGQIAAHLSQSMGSGDGQVMHLVLEDGSTLRGYVRKQAAQAVQTGAVRPRVTAGRSW
jgi:tetratricopeptide (TPR) repeat protein